MGGWWEEGAYHVVVDTLAELPLFGAALPELVVPVVEAVPMCAELGEAVSVDVLEPTVPNSSALPQLSTCSHKLPMPIRLFWNNRPFTYRSYNDFVQYTYTLEAQRVTRRPSFMHSSSPRPGFSVLHCM